MKTNWSTLCWLGGRAVRGVESESVVKCWARRSWVWFPWLAEWQESFSSKKETPTVFLQTCLLSIHILPESPVRSTEPNTMYHGLLIQICSNTKDRKVDAGFQLRPCTLVYTLFRSMEGSTLMIKCGTGAKSKRCTRIRFVVVFCPTARAVL